MLKNIALFVAFGQLYYVKEAVRLFGLEPFTALVLSEAFSGLVDFAIQFGNQQTKFRCALFGNAIAGLVNIALGFYSIKIANERDFLN